MNDNIPEDEFGISDPNWRTKATDDLVIICGQIEATEYEVMLAVEKLTPIIRKKHNRYPNESDVLTFIYVLRGE